MRYLFIMTVVITIMTVINIGLVLSTQPKIDCDQIVYIEDGAACEVFIRPESLHKVIDTYQVTREDRI